MPTPRPHHNRRQRKKLRIGEFQEFGFEVSATCPPAWTDAQRDAAVDGLIAAVEARGLCYGGGDSASGLDGYIARMGPGSASDADRTAIEQRMQALGFTDVIVAPLSDAWHGEDDVG